MESKRYYVLSETTGEFEQCAEDLYENSLGNKMTVTNVPEAPDTPDSLRYRLEIDDFGYAIAAMNRLVQQLTPTFVFPETVHPVEAVEKKSESAIEKLKARLFEEDVYGDSAYFYQVAVPALLVVTVKDRGGAEAARQSAMALRAEHDDPNGVPVWSIIGQVHNEAKLYLPDSPPNDYEILSGPQE